MRVNSFQGLLIAALTFRYSIKQFKKIKAKYEQLQYMPKDEDNSEDQYDLNAQLYAAARTNELLTSLRLLAQGF